MSLDQASFFWLTDSNDFYEHITRRVGYANKELNFP
jgi:hypothetical protein